jgi:protein ImuB
MLKTKYALLPGRTSRLRPVPPSNSRPAPQYPRSLWYALHFPQLTGLDNSDQYAIREFASLCMQVSDHISIVCDDALVVEIRSSLKYFGGIHRIRQTLQTSLQTRLQEWNLPVAFYEAASPSAQASIMLARAGINRLIPDRQNLRSALGSIAISHLALDAKTIHRLEQCGLLYLRDLWRLPTAGLRIRFGRALSEHLEQLLAQRPSTFKRWQPAIAFCETLTPDTPAENQQDILLLASELLARMQSFLQKNHKSTDHILFELHDETGSVESFSLGTRRPVREKALWILLLENRIADLKLTRSVRTLTLSILDLHDYQPAGANPNDRGKMINRATGGNLLETLCARLGEHSIFCLDHQADYDPVASGKYLEYSKIKKIDFKKTLLHTRGFGLREQQPCWLLPSPQPLILQHELPFYLSPLTFLRGPERIETQWWSGKDIRRDYYIASNQQGMMLWVYRDIGKRSWFLQGLFA